MSDGGSINRSVRRVLRRLLYVLLLAVFIYSVSRLLCYYLEYQRQERSQEEAVETYIKEAVESETPAGGEKRKEASGGEDVFCPITADFDALLAENGDVVGWLYCEDTNINYPVVQGKDNDYYLHRGWDRKESRAGAIFMDAKNKPDFADNNTIIYGHHMKNGGMFAGLSDFADQEFFDAHPVMWLLTPEQTYKVELLGGYLTSDSSDSYTIFTGAGEEFDEYLRKVAADSDVQTEAEMPEDGHYIMLSTCEYNFENARYVLHGRLVPVGEKQEERK